MTGFAILLLFDLAGLALNAAGVPLPTNVLGLLLLAGALATGLLKPERVQPAADFLLRHIVLFFVPAVAAITVSWHDLAPQWPAVIGGTVGGVVASILAAGWTANALAKPEDVPADPDAGAARDA